MKRICLPVGTSPFAPPTFIGKFSMETFYNMPLEGGIMNRKKIDCTDLRNASLCKMLYGDAPEGKGSNFPPSIERVTSETQKLVKEATAPFVSEAEEDELKRTVLTFVFGTVIAVIGFVTALVVNEYFATIFTPSLLTTVLVIAVAIGVSVILGIIQVRVSRAVLKTEYFEKEQEPLEKQMTPPSRDWEALPEIIAGATKVRDLYETAYHLCDLADLTASEDQTLMEGSPEVNVRNICTQEIFAGLIGRELEAILPPKKDKAIQIL